MRFLLTSILAAGLLLPVPSAAETLQAQVVRELQAQGFEVTEARSTLLGRYRIVAEAPGLQREIVLNPRTGEVLRDLVRPVAPGNDRTAPDAGSVAPGGSATDPAAGSGSSGEATGDRGQAHDGGSRQEGNETGREDSDGQENIGGR